MRIIDDILEISKLGTKQVKAIEKDVAVALEANPGNYGLTADDKFSKEAYVAIDELLYKMMRNDILLEEKRQQMKFLMNGRRRRNYQIW